MDISCLQALLGVKIFLVTPILFTEDQYICCPNRVGATILRSYPLLHQWSLQCIWHHKTLMCLLPMLLSQDHGDSILLNHPGLRGTSRNYKKTSQLLIGFQACPIFGLMFWHESAGSCGAQDQEKKHLNLDHPDVERREIHHVIAKSVLPVPGCGSSRSHAKR